VLVVNRQLGITNDVNEENVRDLELDLFFNFARHFFARTVRKSLSYIKLGAESGRSEANVQQSAVSAS